MFKPDKPRLLHWMYRAEHSAGIIDFAQLLTVAAGQALGMSAIDAATYVEANLNANWNYLIKAQQRDRERGLHTIFHVEDESTKRLRWCPAPGTAAVRHYRETVRLRSRHVVLSTIDQLTDRQYEALGCVASRIAGSVHRLLTPKLGDKGVDFYASIIAPGRCHVFSGSVHPLRVVGQSKKYTYRVGGDKVMQFAKTLDNVRHASTEIIDTVPAWFRNATGPIVGWMIGHSGFQSGARETAKNQGIILSDSLDLAELVALSRSLPESDSAEQRAQDLVQS